MEGTTTTPRAQWEHVGGGVRLHGAGEVRVLKTRSGEVRLEVRDAIDFEWIDAKKVDNHEQAN